MLFSAKTASLAFMAALVIAAIGPSAASANNFHSNTASGTTYITGVQVGTNVFDLANGTTVKCTSVVHDAIYLGTTPSGQITLTPTYSGCTAAGQNALIEMTGCQYFINTPTKLVDTDTYDATTQVTCPGANVIHINIPTAGCSLTIAAQIPKTPLLDLTNITSATANQDDILLKSTLTGIQYTTTGGGICGAAGEAKYTGEITYRAYENSTHTTQRDFWIL